MEKFEFHVIGITTKQSLEYDLCDLEAKAFYDIWWHFDNLDKTIVFANNFDDSREMFLKRLGKIDLAIKEDNWIITHDCDKKHLPGLAASIIAKYHRWENLKVLSEVKQFSGSSFANIPNNNGEAMDLGGIGWAAIPPKF
jgi:ribonuclease HII